MDLKKEIIDWFNGPQDYQEGILLLQEVTKKQKVLGKLIKRGDSKAATEKLKWELNKIAGFTKIPAPTMKVKMKVVKKAAAAADKAKKTKTEAPDNKFKLSLIGDKSIDSYPDTVKRLVNEYSALYLERGVSHKALTKLGDGNDEKTVSSRKVLIDEIALKSDRMEILNEAFEEFEKDGTTPDETKLWPTEPGGDITGDSSAKNLEGIKVEELKILKKNIQSSVTKDRNLLLYQVKTKGKKENPMPKGPKRTTLEKRIAKKEAEIVRIDQQIADLG
jgi:hypothetical protein